MFSLLRAILSTLFQLSHKLRMLIDCPALKRLRAGSTLDS